MALPSASDVEYVGTNGPGGASFGKDEDARISFYGETPVAQRAAAIQAASVVSAASYISVSTNLSVFAAEVAATLTALGIWKGAA